MWACSVDGSFGTGLRSSASAVVFCNGLCGSQREVSLMGSEANIYRVIRDYVGLVKWWLLGVLEDSWLHGSSSE